MSSMVQVRNVPDALHRKLKARAALAGMSLSDYILAELKRSLERPTREEFLDRLSHRSRVKLKTAPADAVRAERDGR
jgi:plasmid stability protein